MENLHEIPALSVDAEFLRNGMHAATNGRLILLDPEAMEENVPFAEARERSQRRIWPVQPEQAAVHDFKATQRPSHAPLRLNAFLGLRKNVSNGSSNGDAHDKSPDLPYSVVIETKRKVE
jgi:hypothetical protein